MRKFQSPNNRVTISDLLGPQENLLRCQEFQSPNNRVTISDCEMGAQDSQVNYAVSIP